ncbi:MAG: ATP-binding protein, partial [Verrucomicrobia bacterium]|nr:ATP-binding protein [Prolixibacteraceae bacterium]
FTPPKGTIKVWYEPHERFTRISIKDSGVGIDKDKLQGLFEIGLEKISTDTSGEKSSGLGLSICKEFVEAMKGRIWVESEKGEGSQFTFELLVYDSHIHHSKPRPVPKENIDTPVLIS